MNTKFTQIPSSVTALGANDTLVGVNASGQDVRYTGVQVQFGGKTFLTSNSDYYVSATGSDGPSADGSLAKPWLTLDHAMAALAATVDGGGFGITLHLGAGSFQGFGLRPVDSLIYLYLLGAGIASTTITSGPNDLIWNVGEAISSYYTLSYNFLYNGVTLSSAFGVNLSVFASNIIINGQPTNNLPGNVAHVLSCSASAIELGVPGAYYQDNSNGVSTCHISGGSGTQRFLFAHNNASAHLTGTYTLVGTPTYKYFFEIGSGASVDSYGLSAYVGAGTGAKYAIYDGGRLLTTYLPPGTDGVLLSGGYVAPAPDFSVAQADFDQLIADGYVISPYFLATNAASGVFPGLFIRLATDAGTASRAATFLDGSNNGCFVLGPGGLTNFDVELYRGGAGVLSLLSGSTAASAAPAAFQVYNTVDNVASPANYERGVFDWTTTSNSLTIGMQKAGTGLGRDVVLTAPGDGGVGASGRIRIVVGGITSWFIESATSQLGDISFGNTGTAYFANSTGEWFASGFCATGDPGGFASTNTLTNGASTTISTGVGVIHMSTANPATNSGWLKCYIGTQVAWIPCWTTNAP